MNVLIVDDSKAMRLIVKRALRQAGLDDLQVREAGNGKEALACMGDANPDLVLCDLNMPEMNGMELLRALRGEGNRVRFGLVTSEGSDDVRAEAMDAGASFVVVKPFTADSFRSVLSGDSGVAKSAGLEPAGTGTLPKLDAVGTLLGTLLRPQVKVGDGKLVVPSPRKVAALATYGADDGTMEAVVAMEIGVTIAVGCALTGLPASQVEARVAEASKATTLQGELHENVREVFNVLASLFGGELPGSGNLRELVAPCTCFPDELSKTLRKTKKRASGSLDVAGYGSGNFTLFRLD